MHPTGPKPVLALLLIFFITPLYSQDTTIVHDGQIGIVSSWSHDGRIVINTVLDGSPAARAGIQTGDTVIAVNKTRIKGLQNPNMVYENLISHAGGSKIEFDVLRGCIDSLIHLTAVMDTILNRTTIIKYDYLVDPGGKYSIHDILDDSLQQKFCGATQQKIKVYSVNKGGFAEHAGIQPGDQLISLYDEMFIHYLVDNGFYSTDDTTITILRDSMEIDIPLDVSSDQDIGLISQFGHDLKQEVLWLRLNLENRIVEDRTYLFNFWHFDSIIVFQPVDSTRIIIKKSGDKLAADEHDYLLKDENVIRVPLKKDRTETIYIKLYESSGIQYPPYIQISTLKYTTELDRMQRFAFGAFLGMMLIISIYYLIMATLLKERSYIYFVLFILSYAFFRLYDSGYGEELFWRGSFRILEPVEHVIYSLPVVFFMLFGNTFLSLKTHLRTWYRMVNIVLLIIGLTLTVTVLGYIFANYSSYQGSLFIDIMLVGLIIGLLSGLIIHMITSILRIRQGYRPGWYFLFANILTLLLIISFSIFESVYIKSAVATVLSGTTIEAAAVIQFLIFSVGLAHKIRISEREKEEAREKMIEQLKENEKLKDKINRELEQMVEERTREISMQKEEIEAQRDELAGQRDLLESQKKEITDSINYAKKIQTAVLPSDEMLREMLPEHFVLFRPRDIVSGDFYWARQIKNFTVVVAADSTGHGVPGAFMSMLGMSFLNELVSRSRFDTAGEILDRLRNKVKTTLRQEGQHHQQKDGMDVALVIIDHDSMEVQYAGAFNPLYLLRENAKDVVSLPKVKITTETDTHALHEFKADRQPISVYFNESKFRTLRFTVQPGDTLYIFSDGYIDQMGGPMGKKFKARRFKDLILSVQDDPMKRQKEILETTLDEWRADMEQVDDILLIGIRI